MSLELQRFWALLKVHSIELHAKFGEGRVGGCGGVLVRDFFLPACRVGGGSGKKFSLLGLLVAEAVKSSPCMRKVGRNRRFGACWESFVPEVAPHAG